MCLGIPGRIVRITDRERLLAVVEVGAVEREISLACIVDAEHPLDACVGEWVLVHVGFALTRVAASEAAATLALLDSLDDPSELDEREEV